MVTQSNYTIAGVDLYFCATIEEGTLDSGTTTGQGSDFRIAAHNLGNIVTAELSPEVTYLEHFITTTDGDKRRDHMIAVSKSLTIPFTFDEINENNLTRYLYGQSITDASCDSATPVFSVMSKESIIGSAQIYVRTDVGNDYIYFIPKCMISPDGNMSLTPEDWWTGPMKLDVLYHAWTPDNIASNTTVYYGIISAKSIT
jgi:hypothetical protein